MRRKPPVEAVPPPMDEATADALLDAVDALELWVRFYQEGASVPWGVLRRSVEVAEAARRAINERRVG